MQLSASVVTRRYLKAELPILQSMHELDVSSFAAAELSRTLQVNHLLSHLLLIFYLISYPPSIHLPSHLLHQRRRGSPQGFQHRHYQRSEFRDDDDRRRVVEISYFQLRGLAEEGSGGLPVQELGLCSSNAKDVVSSETLGWGNNQ